MMKAIIYLRVSTEEQAERGYSLQGQREECRNKAYDLGIADHHIHEYCEEGVSGSILERPMLIAALEKVKEGNISCFICLDSSRLSRNVAHQLILIDELKKHKVKLVFVRNSYEDNAEGRFQLTIMAAVDEYERARLKLRCEMGKRAKAQSHKLTHNPNLYGYMFEKEKDILTIVEKEADIVKMIFQWVISNHYNMEEISKRLNLLGIPSPRNKTWHRNTVRRIVKNKSYTGILYIRRYDTREYRLNKFKSKKEKIKITEKPKEEWIPIKIPAIIDEEIWEEANNQVVERKAHRTADTLEVVYSSLVKCGICGSSLAIKRIASKKGNNANCYYYCTSKYKKNNSCTLRNLSAEALDKIVWNELSQIVFHRHMFNYILNSGMCYVLYKEEKNEIRLINEKMEAIREERKRIINLYQKGIIDSIEMSEKINNICLAEKNLQEIKDDIDGRILNKKNNLHCYFNNSSCDREVVIERLIVHLSEDDKRELLKTLISKIVVYNDTIVIQLLVQEIFNI